MNVRSLILLGLLFSLLSLNAFAVDSCGLGRTGGAAKRLTLVIGNDHYRCVDPLRNAVQDARSMAGALEKSGSEEIRRGA